MCGTEVPYSASSYRTLLRSTLSGRYFAVVAALCTPREACGPLCSVFICDISRLLFVCIDILVSDVQYLVMFLCSSLYVTVVSGADTGCSR